MLRRAQIHTAPVAIQPVLGDGKLEYLDMLEELSCSDAPLPAFHLLDDLFILLYDMGANLMTQNTLIIEQLENISSLRIPL